MNSTTMKLCWNITPEKKKRRKLRSESELSLNLNVLIYFHTLIITYLCNFRICVHCLQHRRFWRIYYLLDSVVHRVAWNVELTMGQIEVGRSFRVSFLILHEVLIGRLYNYRIGNLLAFEILSKVLIRFLHDVMLYVVWQICEHLINFSSFINKHLQVNLYLLDHSFGILDPELTLVGRESKREWLILCFHNIDIEPLDFLGWWLVN